MLNQIHNKVLM